MIKEALFNFYVSKKNMINEDVDTIAIVGMGYVGLPLAIAFGTKRRVVCFGYIKKRGIDELKQGIDYDIRESQRKNLTKLQNLCLLKSR